MIQIGDIEISLVNDGVVHVDAGGAFGLVPRALWGQILPPDANNLVPMTLHNLVVRVGEQVIVVDTGLGDKLTPKEESIWRLERPHGGLMDGLQRLGLKASDIDLVIDTHLHADHCAGSTSYDASGRIVARFPNAEYVVHGREYEDAMHPNERTRATYHPVNYQPLFESGQMRLLTADEEEVAPGVFVVRTPGHTPGHLAVRLESGGLHAMFVCDMASYAIHFERLGWMTAYDVEPLITLETKRRWQHWALEHHALLIFPHDHQVPAARFVQPAEGRPRLVPVPVAYS